MTYGFLLESVWHPPLVFDDVSNKKLPTEIELQALWFSGGLGREFRTTSGQLVKVIQFGEWNRGSGPDFHQVSVEIGGVVHQGALELDPTSAAWDSHGHATNPAFNHVVLHVVFQSDFRKTFIRTSEHREVPQVVISEMQLADAMNLPQRDVAIAHPGRCIHPLKGISKVGLERLMDESAMHRANLKASRFLRIVEAHGRDEALFQVTAETLGYRSNTLAMRLLAQRASLRLLRDQTQSAEAILFGTAGFLSPNLHQQAPEGTRVYLRGLWDDWWKSRVYFEVSGVRQIPWRMNGQRPVNHPHRRVGALSALVAAWPEYRKVAFARPFSAKAVLDFLAKLEHPFWNVHHTLTSLPSARKIAPMGRSHGMELLANHLIPLALVEGGMSFDSYRQLRHSTTNEKVKRCGLRLFGSEQAATPWSRRLSHHQALLQIYQDFCLEDFSQCERCPFPEQLSQWK
jgi:hypothetical protein